MYQLQIFLSVVDRGSFSGAAEELHLTQPAVSMQVRALEERYGVKLFSRVGQRIELTEAGRSLLTPARKLLMQAHQVEEHFSAGLGELRGRLTIGYGTNSASTIYLLPQYMGGFRERFDKVQFTLSQMDEELILNQVLERELNMGIVNGRPRQRGLDEMVLLRDSLVLAVPSNHKWAGKTLRLAELKSEPFILRATGSETRRRGELALRAIGLTYADLQVVAEVDTAEAVALLAEQGMGVGFLAGLIARRFCENGRLAIANIHVSQDELRSGAELTRELFIVRLAAQLERQASPAQERFWEFLRIQLSIEKTARQVVKVD
jgi:DNA-binding transcriptional LysR family regulator